MNEKEQRILTGIYLMLLSGFSGWAIDKLFIV